MYGDTDHRAGGRRPEAGGRRPEAGDENEGLRTRKAGVAPGERVQHRGRMQPCFWLEWYATDACANIMPNVSVANLKFPNHSDTYVLTHKQADMEQPTMDGTRSSLAALALSWLYASAFSRPPVAATR